MSDQATEQAYSVEEHGPNLFKRVGSVAVKGFMVGLGTIGLAQDEVKKLVKNGGSFIQRLEDRGEEMTHSGRESLDKQRDQINTRLETRQDQVKEIGSKANESFEKASGAVLTRANIPTSADIQALSKQIGSLSRKVDKLRKEQEELAAQQTAQASETSLEE